MKIEKHMYKAGDEAGWLALRNSMKYRVGGSELGAIAGHSPYSSFLKLLAIRVGARQEDDLSENEAVRAGKDLEYYVADRFAEVSGKKVHQENCIFTNDIAPHCKATIDRKIAGEDSGLECKTAQDLAMRKFKSGDFPQSYFDQCALYLLVTNLTRWYLSIYVWGKALRVFLMTRNKAEADRYTELKKRFDFADKFGTLPNGIESDADYKEWKEKWAYIEAVYYISDEELGNCEVLASRFVDAVKQVENYLKDKTFNTEQERINFTWNAVYQVVDPEMVALDGDGTDATKDVLSESPSVVDKEVQMNPNTDTGKHLQSILARRKEIINDLDKLKEEKEAIENEISITMKDAEMAYLPFSDNPTEGWKMTFKMSSPRRSVTLNTVETYFASQAKEIPQGIITTSEPTRQLRIYPWKAKAIKSNKSAA